MNVAVLVAGIADPKWPLDGAHPRIASPFDESALEVALKLRDADPSTRVTILLSGDAGDEALSRTLASHRPDRLVCIPVPQAVAWDAAAQGRFWKEVLTRLAVAFDLVLAGREFGDRDDGALPACLAEVLGWSFVGLAQDVSLGPGGLEVLRERGTVEERRTLAPPFVASVTNDRRNRLRHPLMKNVMAARKAPIESMKVEAPAVADVSLEVLEDARPPARVSACRMLEGPLDDRVAALARFLEAWKAAA